MRDFSYVCTMIKKIILRIFGYRYIDRISGLWKHSFKTHDGKETAIMSYAHYDVYYSSKRDRYVLDTSGFEPLKHILNSRLRVILEGLNDKDPDFPYMENIQDYFIQKEVLLNYLQAGFGDVSSVEGSDLIILRFDLEQKKEFIMKFRDPNPLLITALEGMMKSATFPSSAEVYEKIDNIAITSEGYFVATQRENLNRLESKDEEE